MSSPQTPLHYGQGTYVGDEPIDRVIFETLSDEQRARLRGAIIFNRLIDNGISEKLVALKRQREGTRGRNGGLRKERFGGQPLAVLAVLCLRFGVIVPGVEGLMVYEERETIAAAIGGSWKSTYPVMRQLDEAGAITIAGGRPGQRFVFEMLWPPQSDREKASERARSAADGCGREQIRAANPLTTPDLARAPQPVSLPQPNGVLQTGDFEAPAEAAQKARAPQPYDDDDDDDSKNISSSSCAQNPHFDQVVKILRKRCGMWGHVAGDRARTTSLEDALALALMREDQPKLSQAGAGGWCLLRLDGGDITDEYRTRARKLLKPTPAATPEPAMAAASTKGGSDDDDDYRIG